MRNRIYGQNSPHLVAGMDDPVMLEGGSPQNLDDNYVSVLNTQQSNQNPNPEAQPTTSSSLLPKSNKFYRHLVNINTVLLITICIMVALLHHSTLQQLHSLHTSSQSLNSHLSTTDTTVSVSHDELAKRN